MQVLPLTYWFQIATGRAHAAAGCDGRLAHRDAVLTGAIVIRVMNNPDLARCLDQRGVERVARLGVRDLQRSLSAAEFVVASSVTFHAFEHGQHVLVAPAPVSHLRPGVEVLSLAADESHAIEGTGAAKQPAPRDRQLAAVGVRLGL